MNLNDSTINPPAFSSDTQVGMTLLDWFAGQALAGLLASEAPEYTFKTIGDCVSRAYELAEAMLGERGNRLADSITPTAPDAF